MPDGTEETASPENILADLNTRIRVLEERYNLLREKLTVTNQNMIGEYKNISTEVKAINSDIKELRDEINNIKDTLKEFIKEMANFARKDSVKVLEKYINMWNPLNFVTEKDVIKLIEEHSKRGGKGSKSKRASD